MATGTRAKSKNTLRHFSRISEVELHQMWTRCTSRVLEYAEEIGMSGLSEGGSHNVYTALHTALYAEWQSARKAHQVE